MRFRTTAFENIKITLKYNVNLNIKMCTTVSVRLVIYPNIPFLRGSVQDGSGTNEYRIIYYSNNTILYSLLEPNLTNCEM